VTGRNGGRSWTPPVAISLRPNGREKFIAKPGVPALVKEFSPWIYLLLEIAGRTRLFCYFSGLQKSKELIPVMMQFFFFFVTTSPLPLSNVERDLFLA